MIPLNRLIHVPTQTTDRHYRNDHELLKIEETAKISTRNPWKRNNEQPKACLLVISQNPKQH